MHDIQRNPTKKIKLDLNSCKFSEEIEVLKILKNSNLELEDLELIDKCMKTHIFMRNLESIARKEVIKQMSYCFVPKDSIIFYQGSKGNFFYIIKIGKVNLYINDEKKKTLMQGESFGELALLHESKRSGTIKSTEDTYLWCLDRKKFKQVSDYINNKNFEENRKFVQSIPLIKNMDSVNITRLASNLIKVIYDPNNFIVKEGEPADCIYIIKEGSVECTKGNKFIRCLSKGDFFGINSVLTETPRSLNVIAKTVCVIYSISVGILTLILGPNFKDILFLNFIKIAIKNSKSFGKINISLIEQTYSCFKVKRFFKGNIVLPKGTLMNKKIIIIIEGNLSKCEVPNNNNNSSLNLSCSFNISSDLNKYSGRGKILFDDDFTFEKNDINNKLNFDLIADPDCFLLEADLEDFTKLIGGTIFDVTEKSCLIDALQKIPLFKNFNEKQIYSIADAVKLKEFNINKKIIEEKEIGSKFYIVKSGKVDVFARGKYVRTLNENEYFGEKSLFIKEPRSATVIAADNKVILYEFDEDIFINLPENIREYIAKRIPLQDETIQLNQLDYIQTLGKGNFGSVHLVSCKKNNCLYALKAISKAQIDQDQIHPNLEMERRILLKIDHPFIMKMVKSLKDEHDVYFLTEYIRGKEMWDVLRDIGLLNKEQSLFYACSLMIAVDYLHKRKFIYRDIKPENIILTESVFINLYY
jgi:cGMP-dependent protein kinase